MGSYAEYLTEEERWHLASYVNSISGDEKPGARILIKPKLIKGNLPESPEDPVFKETGSIIIPLSGQIISRPEKETRMLDSIMMKSIYNDREIVFLFEWDDITGLQSKSFKDALTIQFLLNKNIGMKDSDHNINMWYWKALLEGSFSNTVDELNEKSLLREFNIRDENVLIQQSEDNQDLKGKSAWQNGKWKIVLKRSLTTDEEDDVQFKKGNLIRFVLSAWDGTNGKYNAEKAISTWYYLMVGKPYHYRKYLYSFLGLIIGASIEMLIIGRVRKKSFSKKI
jgi:DMSO reductase family type II enzyme heme b subunit